MVIPGREALSLLCQKPEEIVMVYQPYVYFSRRDGGHLRRVFGLGSVLSMGVMTIFISMPFVYSANRLPNLNSYIQAGVGALSILIGMLWMYKIGFTEGLF